MPIYSFKCTNKECNHEFESIEKVGAKFSNCLLCKSISSRYKVDIPSPAQIEVGVGGVYKGRFEERNFQ